MKIKEARVELAFYSGKLSDIVRQLGLTGLAVIWVLRIQSPIGNSIPNWLIPAGLLILFGLAIDLLQYAAGARYWGRFSRRKQSELEERQRDLTRKGEPFDLESQEFPPPPDRDIWTRRFFWAKFGVMLFAYAFLIFYLLKSLLTRLL
jgi:hypothetical protein